MKRNTKRKMKNEVCMCLRIRRQRRRDVKRDGSGLCIPFFPCFILHSHFFLIPAKREREANIQTSHARERNRDKARERNETDDEK